jgi:hypothetical protein
VINLSRVEGEVRVVSNEQVAVSCGNQCCCGDSCGTTVCVESLGKCASERRHADDLRATLAKVSLLDDAGEERPSEKHLRSDAVEEGRRGEVVGEQRKLTRGLVERMRWLTSWSAFRR